jgi:hypothetical protein
MSIFHHIHPKEGNEHHTVFEKIWFSFQKQTKKTKTNIELVSIVLIIGIIAISATISRSLTPEHKTQPKQAFVELPITSNTGK